MRDDLGMYLKVLRSAMIELINADYQDFVNLSTELVDLDKRIQDIQTPIAQLREEILNVKDTLTGTMDEISECLQEKRLLNVRADSIRDIERLSETVVRVKDLLSSGPVEEIKLIQLLERLALDVVHLEFIVKLYGSQIDETLKSETSEVQKMLLEKLKHCFLRANENKDQQAIEKCLNIYIMLNQISIAEQVIKKSVVAQKMNGLICESSLQSNPKGVIGIYDQILDFLNAKLNDLLKITTTNPKMKCFNFLLNSFWSEVEQRIELSMNSIFAPGNPDQFHQKFTSTLQFLEKIESQTDDPNAFKNHSQYKSFMVKWNLMVYFQIRFQEIGAILETVCCKELNQEMLTPEDKFKLIPFSTALSCITKCWSDGVYLPHLFSRFFKLTLQFISRVGTWIDTVLEQDKIECANYTKVDFLMLLYLDVLCLDNELPNILIVVTSKSPKVFETQKNLLEICFNESKGSILGRLSRIESKIAEDLIANSAPYIKQVNDIPRLYRKTNRDIPNKNCSYLDHTLTPSKEFYSKYEGPVGSQRLTSFLGNVFSSLTEQ